MLLGHVLNVGLEGLAGVVAEEAVVYPELKVLDLLNLLLCVCKEVRVFVMGDEEVVIFNANPSGARAPV